MNPDAIANENEALRELLYLAPVGLMRFDIHGRIKQVNPVMIQLLKAGSPNADLNNAYQALRDFPSDIEAQIRSFGAAIGPIIVNERLTTRAGDHSRVLTLSLFRHDDDVFIARISDITAAAEQESALRENREILRLALKTGRIETFRRDIPGGTITFELADESLFGIEALRRRLSDTDWLNLVHPEDRDRVCQNVAAAYETRAAELNHEYRLVDSRTQAIRDIDMRSQIIYGETGAPASAIGVAIDVSEKRLTEANIRHLAYHDVLTQLPNRALFQKRLGEALEAAGNGVPFALFSLDLDHFKAINDTFGHPVGDRILVEAANRLGMIARASDTIARLGGDEFALILTDVRGVAECEALAGRMLTSLSTPHGVGEQNLLVGASIGVAIAAGSPPAAQEIVRQADLALCRAKAGRRGQCCFYDPAIDEPLYERRTLSLAMHAALANNEFELFYQPMMDVARRELVGLEALIRWRHPEQGLLPPDVFIPLAESTGFIIPLGAWVLRQACLTAVTWGAALRVAVNLSPVQVLHDGVVADIETALSASGLPAERLEVELTEAVGLTGTPRNIAILGKIRDLGVSLVLDDFGAGYSSLGYLRLFPFTKVKIDRALTADVHLDERSDRIVTSAVRLCADLGLRTLAEGIETEAQMRLLQRMGCDEAQGHLFSPPAPARELAELTRRLRIQ